MEKEQRFIPICINKDYKFLWYVCQVVPLIGENVELTYFVGLQKEIKFFVVVDFFGKTMKVKDVYE